MRRRDLTIFLGVAAFAPPLCARAQKRQRVYRVGVLGLGSPALSPVLVAILKQEMQDLGYIEGQNIVIEYRWTEGRTERLLDLAIDLVAQKPDVIVAITSDGTRAAKQATTTIPIVMAIVADPVGSGFVTSLAHPGGNITGVTDFGIEMVAKHVELIHALLPNVTQIGVLMSDNPVNPRQFKAIEDAAKVLGLTVVAATNKSNEDLESAFASLTTENAKALVVLGGARHVSQRYKIAELATQARLPTVFPTRLYVEAGGLLSYGPSLPHTYKLAALYVDKILKGAKPADLPVQQPTTFNMVINMKTAKALGLTIPQSVLLRADEVIE